MSSRKTDNLLATGLNSTQRTKTENNFLAIFLVSSRKVYLLSITFSLFSDYQALPGYQGLCLVPDYLRIFPDVIIRIFLIGISVNPWKASPCIQIKLTCSESSWTWEIVQLLSFKFRCLRVIDKAILFDRNLKNAAVCEPKSMGWKEFTYLFYIHVYLFDLPVTFNNYSLKSKE